MNEKSAPARRQKLQIRPGRYITRLRDDIPAPPLEVALERIRGKPGLFESLSDEARKLWDSYEGPENHGPPL